MSIDFEHFTPGAALAGGALIGLSVAWLLLVHGRIAGISGLLGRLVGRAVEVAVPRHADPGGLQWPIALAFLAGLAIAPRLFAVSGHPVQIHVDASWPVLVAAGVLVGIGTRASGGCTSGHGVCGLSNLSLRSLVATLNFMAVAMVTVAVQRWLA